MCQPSWGPWESATNTDWPLSAVSPLHKKNHGLAELLDKTFYRSLALDTIQSSTAANLSYTANKLPVNTKEALYINSQIKQRTRNSQNRHANSSGSIPAVRWSLFKVKKVSSKVKLCLCSINYAIKHYTMGEWSNSFTVLELGTSWRWVVRFKHTVAVPWGKYPRYPLDKRLGGSKSRSGCCGDEKISCFCWESNAGRPFFSMSIRK
jgi:hypothetical protein